MRRSIVLILATALGGALSPALAAQHQHAPPPKAAQAAPAQRFATDATLRKEMKGVRTAVEALAHYEMGHMGAAQAVEFATQIEGHVRTIVAECKLPPDADAALHAIIVPLVQEAGALKAKPQDLAPIERMRAALASYDRQFFDP